jgi:hypothetical protein
VNRNVDAAPCAALGYNGNGVHYRRKTAEADGGYRSSRSANVHCPRSHALIID